MWLFIPYQSALFHLFLWMRFFLSRFDHSMILQMSLWRVRPRIWTRWPFNLSVCCWNRHFSFISWKLSCPFPASAFWRVSQSRTMPPKPASGRPIQPWWSYFQIFLLCYNRFIVFILLCYSSNWFNGVQCSESPVHGMQFMQNSSQSCWGTAGAVHSVLMSRRGNCAVTGSADGSIRSWCLEERCNESFFLRLKDLYGFVVLVLHMPTQTLSLTRPENGMPPISTKQLTQAGG